MGMFAAVFILTMIVTFWVKGAVPDTLIQYTLGAGGVEAFLLASIKISKVLSENKQSMSCTDIKNVPCGGEKIITIEDTPEEVIER